MKANCGADGEGGVGQSHNHRATHKHSHEQDSQVALSLLEFIMIRKWKVMFRKNDNKKPLLEKKNPQEGKNLLLRLYGRVSPAPLCAPESCFLFALAASSLLSLIKQLKCSREYFCLVRVKCTDKCFTSSKQIGIAKAPVLLYLYLVCLCKNKSNEAKSHGGILGLS